MVSVYIAAHKPIDIKEMNLDNCFKIIRVGQYAQAKSELISDNTGDNISDKNPNFCELTALYWIWKNDKNSDVVGLCHYRRYFTKAALSVDSRHFLKEKDIESCVKRYDVIASRKEYCYRGAYAAYLDCGREKDLRLVKEAIERLAPDYLPFYESEFENASGNYVANMMIAKKEIFDKYCEWLFPILFYVEQNADLTGYSKAEARIYGYISERLLGVWTAKNRLKVKTFRVVNTEAAHGFGFYFEELTKFIGLYQKSKDVVFKLRNRRKALVK